MILSKWLMLAWVGKSSNPFMKYFSPPLIGLPHPILSNLLETPPSWTLRLPSLSRAVSLSTPPCEYISLLIVILFDTSQFDFLFQKEIETSVYRIIMWQMKKREVTWVTVCVCSGDPILDEGGDFDLDETMDMARQVEEFLSQPSEAQWSRQQSWPFELHRVDPWVLSPPINFFFLNKCLIACQQLCDVLREAASLHDSNACVCVLLATCLGLKQEKGIMNNVLY